MLVISYPPLFKSFTNLQKSSWNKKELWIKTRNAEHLKIKYHRRRIKLRHSIDKKTILHKILFSIIYPSKYYCSKVFLSIFNNISEQNCLDELGFNKVNRVNHSSTINNTVTNKIKHFRQSFTLDPQIPLTLKW